MTTIHQANDELSRVLLNVIANLDTDIYEQLTPALDAIANNTDYNAADRVYGSLDEIKHYLQWKHPRHRLLAPISEALNRYNKVLLETLIGLTT